MMFFFFLSLLEIISAGKYRCGKSPLQDAVLLQKKKKTVAMVLIIFL